jgi:hypothetical protein
MLTSSHAMGRIEKIESISNIAKRSAALLEEEQNSGRR